MDEASHVTQILNSLQQDRGLAADQLIPLVYAELRRLAAQRLGREQAGQTLQPTALVHEAYLRLVDVEHQQQWNSRGHFFAAAAEAMRRILVENARRKSRIKHGGELVRQEFEEPQIAQPQLDFDLLALDEALDRLAATDEPAAQLVKLRYFSGLTVPQAAEAIGVSTRTAERLWTYAKAWLWREIRDR